ncbi:hypothetical protein FPV67DRAFT_242324 [Lyophyllum atratum]|nr:hypothetical protein FPV67DRAFT_242324 [Lyophyllum atratum]
MSNTEYPETTLIAGSDLIFQEDKYIQEYAAYFNLPKNLTRSEALETICQLHPGSTASIPILPHLTFERINGGKIRFIERDTGVETSHPATAQVNKGPPLPEYRRLVRHSRIALAMVEAETRKPPSPGPELISSEDSPPPETPTDAAPLPPNASAPKDPFNMEHKHEIIMRFPTPIDEYEPSPPRRPRGSGSDDDSAASSLPAFPPKPRMKFVYPPIPRSPADREQDYVRAFSPGESWVEKMYADMVRGRRDVNNDLEEVKREVKDALEEVLRADVEFKGEMQSTQEFITYLKQIASAEWTDEILKRASRTAEEGSDASDVDPPGDDEGGDDSGGEDGGGNGGAQRESHEAGDDKGSCGNEEDNDDGRGRSSPADSCGSPSSIPSSSGWYSSRKDALAETANPASPLASPVQAVGASQDAQNHKRDRDDDDSEGYNRQPGPSYKRAKSSPSPSSGKASQTAPPRTTLPDRATPSPSLKRPRDDDDGGSSELEVELSVRLTGSEADRSSSPASQGGSRKKARSDSIDVAEPSSSRNNILSPSCSPRPRRRPAATRQKSFTFFGGSGSDDDNFEPGGSRSNLGLAPGAYDYSSDEEEGEDQVTNPFDLGAPSAGPSATTSNAPPAFHFSIPTQTQPTAGPSNPRRNPRALTRATERLRETFDGGLEAYDYEQDPDWQRRQERHHDNVRDALERSGQGAALETERRIDFEKLRMPNGWLVFASDEEEEEEEEEEPEDGK